ncbi:glycerol-3-phosphate 1-O-acyltransferase PlsY [Erythrobacter sp. 3-20A1M]|uniref:glycerol-3-phosphate 1-O-acyltransferase PlsY n=1 Tax=Erythrobacter sp. 3-20A1M TaxID=2653850 RepID=UPI001BFC5E15|nr:glycerol-3-phosphate 1-O-acyltransferase PlsY [Erythrobacter sp. 3-20A1M]QWC57896.1 glycerol-3-phosphate 1-O-acyltransferase PlsY [Erythrobacter sp. 3-20A1M]
MESLLAALLGYLLGSIPFGLLLTRMAGLGDVRQQGSGNIGATNVLRTGSKWLAAATLVLDLLKGLAAVLLARHFFPYPAAVQSIWWGAAPAAALGAVLGHCFPVWLGFKGGKGVATNAGVAFGLALPLGLTYAFVWIGMLALTRISSLAGMSAVVCAAIAAALFGYPVYVPVLVAIAVIVLWLHRANIGRLLRGEEPRVGKSK